MPNDLKYCKISDFIVNVDSWQLFASQKIFPNCERKENNYRGEDN